MSYLDMLARASQGPATDYHLCLLNKPQSSRVARQFFTAEDVINVWSNISEFETTLYKVERQNRSPYSLHRQQIDAEWQDAYQAWQKSQGNYQNMKQNYSLFRSDEPESLKLPLKTTMSPTDTVGLNRDVKKEVYDNKSSGKDFLLSIAGMFSSGIEDTSENVKSLVADILLKKYGTSNP